MDQLQFLVLLDKYLIEKLSPAEEQAFWEMLELPKNKELLERAIIDDLQSVEHDDAENLGDWEKGKIRLLEKIRQEREAGKKPALITSKPVGKLIYLRKLVAAAAAIVLLFAGIYYFGSVKKTQVPPVVKTLKEVAAPETNRAMITLADGSLLYLDSAGSGTLSQQGNVKLVKLANGQIVYETTGADGTATEQWNTVTNPRGSRVLDIVLSDGSKIWLNAASSITYPVVFSGNERKVNITGEAYFEIAAQYKKQANNNVKLPFIVSSGATHITVLGTHFNVNTYENEKDTRVTLLEGSVNVGNEKKEHRDLILKPGEQAVVNKGQISLNSTPNVEEVMAWKNGLFIMRSTDLPALMRQLERWYDIEVKQEGPLPAKTFGGKLSKDISLGSIMEALKIYGIECRFTNGQLILE